MGCCTSSSPSLQAYWCVHYVIVFLRLYFSLTKLFHLILLIGQFLSEFQRAAFYFYQTIRVSVLHNRILRVTYLCELDEILPFFVLPWMKWTYYLSIRILIISCEHVWYIYIFFGGPPNTFLKFHIHAWELGFHPIIYHLSIAFRMFIPCRIFRALFEVFGNQTVFNVMKDSSFWLLIINPKYFLQRVMTILWWFLQLF